MKKVITEYICQNCNSSYSKWLGQCHSCKKWNSIIEQVVTAPNKKETPYKVTNINRPQNLIEIVEEDIYRVICQDSELNRVLGGGIVPGSLILVGGEPGIGKSTLLLQLAISLKGNKILYITGEESLRQIKIRYNRIFKPKDILEEGMNTASRNQEPENLYLINETNLESIFSHIKKLDPQIIIIDSIQTIFTTRIESAIGTISQIRESTNLLMDFAKKTHVPVFLIGHINKEGAIAGPKLLEHMVDTVLQFEGDKHMNYRILRTIKNRYGSTSELGIYEMTDRGLREVNNPSELFLSAIGNNIPSGISISSYLEGNRSLMIEIQSLVSKATYGTPQRSTTGFDIKRLNMLLAVLDKRAGYNFTTQDVFLNIAGGLKVNDPSIDLAVCVSLASSLLEKKIPSNVCFAAEVGLGGELRPVSRIMQRITEAKKLGFSKVYISSQNMRKKKKQLNTTHVNEDIAQSVTDANLREGPMAIEETINPNKNTYNPNSDKKLEIEICACDNIIEIFNILKL